MVHPQKRIFVKKILESTMIRICETKKKLCEFNPRQNSLYVHLDSLLFDLKYDPSVIEIPVPRYFAEDDRIDLDIIFKEKIDRGGKKGKKKRGKKKGKKKKGKKKKEEKPKEEVKTRDQVEKEILDALTDDYNKKEERDGMPIISRRREPQVEYLEPVQEVIADPFSQDMDFVLAIHIIQKNERGR